MLFSLVHFVVFTIHNSFLLVYTFLDFLDRCAVVLFCVVMYILWKYTESHFTRSQIPCLCKLTWPINVILILIKDMQHAGPRIGMWVKEMASNMSMENITYIVRRKQNVFDNIWGPFRYFLRQNTNVGNLLQQEQALGE